MRRVTRHLLVSIHDVVPHQIDAVATLRHLLRDAGIPRITLLVVPRWHGGEPVSAHPAFVAKVARWVARDGDEVLLHGFHHLEDPPGAPGSLAVRLQAALLTAGEGEFLRLREGEAGRRLADGVAALRSVGLAPQGFVAPAWLYSPGALAALRATGPWLFEDNLALRHTDGLRVRSPVLGLAARRLDRLLLSMLWTEALSRALRFARVVRLGLHPVDATSPLARQVLRRAIARLRRTHTPARYADCARALWPGIAGTAPA